MDYNLRHGSGTDDDLPSSQFNRVAIGGHAAGNGRSTVGFVSYPRMHTDMESQIHHLEQVAYSSVLRAFKAQSDALTWEKEGLITELRKELRVSDDEHRELLTKVNADDIICRIREWRKAGGSHSAALNISQHMHAPVLPSPTVPVPRKRQKTSGGTTPKPGQAPPRLSSMMSTRYPSTGPTPRGLLEPAEPEARDPLVGRKLMTRWPDDNNFYEAVITDYNPVQDQHALTYDTNALEWVNLKEIPPEDIRWVDEDPGISHQSGLGGQGRAIKNPFAASPRRVRGTPKDQFGKGFPQSKNGLVKKVSDEIEILHTDTLIKEVEKVFDASHPNLLEIEKAKKMLKEHEAALIDVIAKLADASDSESGGEQQFLQGQSMDTEQGPRSMQYSGNQYVPSFEVQTRGVGADVPSMARGSLTVTDNQQEEYIDII